MKRFIVAGGVVLLVVAAFVLLDRLLAKPVQIPTVKARKGEFLVSLHVTGQVDAERAVTIAAPRIRNIQITWLAPEGSAARVGDPLVRFDSSQQQADLAENESNLKINETALQRARQELAIQEKELQLNLQRARRNYDEKKHEAPKVAEEAKLELELAELNANSKLAQIRSDVEKAELEVQRARDKLGLARKELDQMTLIAPIPGMVVYLNIWKGTSEGKVQTGDSPWPGQGLINLPDLSDMIVDATVSEVDAAQVTPGQEAVIRLDALPDATFEGKVKTKSTLARHKDPNSKINVFDVDIAIADKDERLKPGMSASAEIVIERTPEVVSVPLEAVFEVGGKPVVYLANKKPRDVKVGRRNHLDCELLSGLEGNETVCLVDPRVAEKGGLPGEKASEPEMNKGRAMPAAAPAGAPNAAPQGGGRGRHGR